MIFDELVRLNIAARDAELALLMPQPLYFIDILRHFE